MGPHLVMPFLWWTSHTNSPAMGLSRRTFFPPSLMQASEVFSSLPFSSHSNFIHSLLDTLQDNSTVPSGKHWIAMAGSGHATQDNRNGEGRETMSRLSSDWELGRSLSYQEDSQGAQQSVTTLQCLLPALGRTHSTLLLTLGQCSGDITKIQPLFIFHVETDKDSNRNPWSEDHGHSWGPEASSIINGYL